MGLITWILIRVRIRVRDVIIEAEIDEERDFKMLPVGLKDGRHGCKPRTAGGH